MESIKYLYETTEMTLQAIADHVGVPFSRVFSYVKSNYDRQNRTARKRVCYRRSKLGDKNPMTGKVGAQHHNYVGVVSDGKGYLMVLKPDWYTGRKGSKHVFHHHIVVCLDMGLTAIPAGWAVHHVDGNPHNNQFGNLVLMTSGDHRRLHSGVLVGATTISKESTLKWVEAHGTPFRRDDMVCSAWEHAAGTSGCRERADAPF